MIQYSKSSVRIAELHYDEPAKAGVKADVIRYQWRFEKVRGTFSFALQTRVIDLSEDPDKLFGRMNAMARRHVRKAAADPVTAVFHSDPSRALAEQFETFYSEFARAKQIPGVNRARIDAMRAEGRLCLSRIDNAQGSALVWHAYFRDRGWARLLHSASVYRLDHSKDKEAELARANRLLHWRDMLALRELGVTTYDLGGWYAGSQDTAKLKINQFKESFGGRVIDLHNTYDAVTMKGRLAVQLHRWKGGE
ncbi:MAG TPA: hypothetical protein VKX39_13965 [Bryobacteraceae bacterium]|jgi:hypothetical protein|nr:hypothetical protein [Bryobacteraceae bacterium]